MFLFALSFGYGQEINGNGIDDDGDCNVDCDDLEFGVQATEFFNGMSASFVIGQTDFVTNTAGTDEDDFDGAYDIALDPITGKLFVSEIFNHRVLRYPSCDDFLFGNNPEAVLGQPDFTTNGIGVASDRLGMVAGIFVDNQGVLWVCDWGNNRVLRFDDAGNKPTGSSADGVLGQSDFSTSFFATSRNGFGGPVDVVVDDSGRLYVADRSNGRVLRFDDAASKPNGANADAVLGSSNYTSYVSTVSQSNLSLTGGIALICNSLFVTDESENRILRWDNPETLANGAPANGVLGQSDFTSSASGTSINSMDEPRFLTSDSHNNLYLSDSRNNRVTIFNEAKAKPDGGDADVVVGQPDFVTNSSGLSANAFNTPRGLMLVENLYQNYLVVGDALNNRFMVFGQDEIITDELTPISGNLDGQDASGSGALSFSLLTQPQNGTVVITNSATGDFTFTPAGSCPFDEDYVESFTYEVSNANGCTKSGGMVVFVADAAECNEIPNNGIDDDGDCNTDCEDMEFGTRKFEYTNGMDAQFVVGQNSFFTNTSGASATKLNNPNDIAMDPVTKKVFVCDTGNHRVLRYASMDDFNAGSPAEAVVGQTNLTSNSPGFSFTKLRFPIGITVDKEGVLWIADWGNNRVVRFDDAGNIGNNAFADGLLGQTNYANGTPGLSATRMNQPVDLVVDEYGNLYVAEDANGRVLRFDNASAKADGAPADAVFGEDGFTSNTTSKLDAVNIKNAIGLAIVCNSLYVSDANNNRVLRWDNPSTLGNGADADGVLGQSDFTSNGSGLNSAKFNTPRFLCGDENNNLFVTDGINQRILIFYEVKNKPDGSSADVVLGQNNFTSGSAGLSEKKFQSPRGIAMIKDGLRTYLAIADEGNHRVVLFGDGVVLTDEVTMVSDFLAGYDPSGSGGLTFELVTQTNIGQVFNLNASTGAFSYMPLGACPYDENVQTTFVYSIANANGCKTYAEVLVQVSDMNPCVEDCTDGLDNNYDGFADDFDPTCDTDGDAVLNKDDIDKDNDGITDAKESDIYGGSGFCTNTVNKIYVYETFGTMTPRQSLYSSVCFENGANVSCSPSYNNSFSGAVNPMEYGIVSNTDDANQGNYNWVSRGDVISAGQMLLYNGSDQAQVIYERMIEDLVVGESIGFSVRLLNLSQIGASNPLPQVMLSVLTPANVVVNSFIFTPAETGSWHANSMNFGNSYGSKLIFRISTPGGDPLYNDFALDNIMIKQKLTDCDNDGIPNIYDLDSDNDGIPDIVEQNGIDADGNGYTDNLNLDGSLMNDANANGADDAYESNALLDTDGDHLQDVFDLDSDNDGLYDVLEAGGIDLEFDGIIGSGPLVDANGNGLSGIVDVNESGVKLVNKDSDSDGSPDAKEVDSDNDGCFDVKEAGFPDGDDNGRLGIGDIGSGLNVNGNGAVAP